MQFTLVFYLLITEEEYIDISLSSHNIILDLHMKIYLYWLNFLILR